MTEPETVTVPLPHGLSATYVLRSYEPPPYVMSSVEHAEAVKHAAARERARREGPMTARSDTPSPARPSAPQPVGGRAAQRPTTEGDPA